MHRVVSNLDSRFHDKSAVMGRELSDLRKRIRGYERELNFVKHEGKRYVVESNGIFIRLKRRFPREQMTFTAADPPPRHVMFLILYATDEIPGPDQYGLSDEELYKETVRAIPSDPEEPVEIEIAYGQEYISDIRQDLMLTRARVDSKTKNISRMEYRYKKMLQKHIITMIDTVQKTTEGYGRR